MSRSTVYALYTQPTALTRLMKMYQNHVGPKNKTRDNKLVLTKRKDTKQCWAFDAQLLLRYDFLNPSIHPSLFAHKFSSNAQQS